jgi:hypothetical protein
MTIWYFGETSDVVITKSNIGYVPGFANHFPFNGRRRRHKLTMRNQGGCVVRLKLLGGEVTLERRLDGRGFRAE